MVNMLCLLQEAGLHQDPAMLHQNLLPVLHVFEDSQSVYLIMDECEGDVLKVLGTKETVSEYDIAKTFHGIAVGVQHCHQRGGYYAVQNTTPLLYLVAFVKLQCFLCRHHAW